MYPSTENVVEELGLRTIERYVQVRRVMIATWVADHPNLGGCKDGAWMCGSVPHLCWWEQSMTLDKPAVPAGERDGGMGSG